MEAPEPLVSTRLVTPMYSFNDAESEIFSVRFSPDGCYLAGACGDGAIQIWNMSSGKRAFVLNQVQGDDILPTTQVSWRPSQAVGNTRSVLISVGADGKIVHWHVPSGKILHEIIDQDNQFYCVDFAADGSQFAAGGKRHEVRIYDEATRKLRHMLTRGHPNTTHGHSKGIFSLAYHPSDMNILLTGGWGNTVQFWDLRCGHAMRAFIGPQICGDALDIASDGQTILTGSWRVEKQLQLWDFRSERLLDTLSWRVGEAPALPCMLYAAKFSKRSGSPMIAAGGGGENEAKLFDREAGGSIFGSVTGLNGACYSVDFSHDDAMIAVGGGDGCVRVVWVD